MYPIAALVLGILIFGGSLIFGDFPHVAGGAIAFPDYLAHWTGGRMLLDGNLPNLYDPIAQSAVQDRDVQPGSLSWFISPPFTTLLYAPFGALSYGPSALLWTALTLGLLIASFRLMRPFAPKLFSKHYALITIVMLSTEPVIEVFGSGQDTGLSLLVWVGGIRLMLAKRDGLAGFVFALGLFKPQQFILIPIVLIIQRRFRALAAWIATAGVLGLMSVSIVGLDGVKTWLRLPSSEFYDKTVHVAQAWKMQGMPALVTTLFPSSWSRGTSVFALILAGAAVVIFIRQMVRTRSRNTTEVEVWMMAMVATVAISPHLFIYDLTLVLVPILYLIEHHNTRTVRLACASLYVLTWTVPLRHVIAIDASWPLSLIEAAWTAIPLIVLWVAFARTLGLGRDPESVRTQ